MYSQAALKMLTTDNKNFTIAANNRLYYYSDNWQVLEEYTVAAVPARKAYYVWGNY